MAPNEKYLIAVDSGGTFSDCCVISSAGEVWTGKAPSTPPNFETGVLNAVADTAERMGMPLATLLGQAELFGHGTTVATNALVTRTGCKTALITTQGHEDAILIGRVHQKVAGLSNWQIRDLANLNKADPVVPKPLIKGVVERVDCFGQVVVPLQTDSLNCIVEELLAEGVEAVAIGTLWSFKNPDHERRIREALLARNPNLFITLSSEIAPVLGEYERIATTAINAYLSKLTKSYLERLKARLTETGFGGTAVVMQSSGGIATIDQVLDKPVALLASGPAGGVIGALAEGKRFGHQKIITSDVGGTTFDVGLIIDGDPVLAQSPVFSQYHLAYPMIEINSIGAGGGSIAWVQPETNLLKVGPMSAGAQPGPVCYGRGGTEPTVTDANLVLGRLNPDYFLGGKATLDLEGARRSLEPIATRLGMSIEETALGIIDIGDAHMSDLLRKMTVQKGHDPREFALYGFGGAGPLQVCGYARGTGIGEIIIPSMASVFSAYGIAQSDLLAIAEASLPLPMPGDPSAVQAAFDGLEASARADLKVPERLNTSVEIQREAYLRYTGQNHDIGVSVTNRLETPEDMEALTVAFETQYEKNYGSGTAYRAAGIMLNMIRVRIIARLELPQLQAASGSSEASPPSMRPVYYRESNRWEPTAFYRLDGLPASFSANGPLFIESPHTTVYVAPDFSVEVDGLKNLKLRPLRNPEDRFAAVG